MIDQQQINILMIEDNPGDVRITQVLLRDDPLVDYTFDTFDTLQASINYLNENDTDIILLDLNLPDSSGTETFTRIQEEFPDLPIVIMSGNVDQETAIEAVRLGAQDSLLKGGVDGPSLSRVIRYAIERNRAELALAREKAELGALVYSIGDAVIATKTDCVITRMNPIAEKLTGWSEEEALGKPLIEVFKMVGEDSRKITECPVKQILDSGKLTTQEEPLLLVNKTGEEIAISNSVSIIKDDQGRVTGAVLIFHDDSDRRMSQRLLETRLELIAFASNHSLREFLLEAVDRISGLVDSPGGFYHFVDEAQGTVRMNVFSSGQEQSILKESDQERLMKIDQVEGWAECVRKKKPVIHNDLRHMPAIESIPAEHTPVQRELIVPILRNGKIVAIVGVGNKAADYDGKDIETVSYLADITWEIVNQKRAEEKLSQSEVHYRQIVETAQEGMWIINADNSVAFINQELADLLGYPKEEIIGSNSLNYVLLEDREFLQEKIRNRREGIKESYEIRILRKDGTPLDALISATPNFDDDEEYTGALVMVTDITERKQAERAIALERDRAQKYFDIAGVMLLVLDSEGKIERINEKGLQILGYKKQEDLIGKDWFTTCLPEDLREETRTIHQGLMEDWKDHGEFIESRVLTAMVRNGRLPGITLPFETMMGIRTLARSAQERISPNGLRPNASGNSCLIFPARQRLKPTSINFFSLLPSKR